MLSFFFTTMRKSIKINKRMKYERVLDTSALSIFVSLMYKTQTTINGRTEKILCQICC